MIERTEVRDAAAMHALGASIGRALAAGDLLVLTGPLGAGKTTLAAGLGEGLGVRGPVSSPTFVLARTHPSLAGGPPLIHVDAYRLSSPAELDDLDLDVERSVVVVEWGAGMVDGIAESVLEIRIARGDDDVRGVELDGRGPRWSAGLLPGPASSPRTAADAPEDGRPPPALLG